MKVNDISNFLDQFTYRFHTALPNFTISDLPQKLKNIKDIPMDSLIAELRSINTVPKLSDDWPIWVDIIVGAIIILGLFYFFIVM